MHQLFMFLVSAVFDFCKLMSRSGIGEIFIGAGDDNVRGDEVQAICAALIL